jgi:hypothetical protein
LPVVIVSEASKLEPNRECLERADNMFKIELVALRDRSEPEVVETFNSNFTEATQVPAVEKTAKFLLENLRRERRATPPDGFQIRAVDGKVVCRFMDDQFTRSHSLRLRLRDEP